MFISNFMEVKNCTFDNNKFIKSNLFYLPIIVNYTNITILSHQFYDLKFTNN